MYSKTMYWVRETEARGTMRGTLFLITILLFCTVSNAKTEVLTQHDIAEAVSLERLKFDREQAAFTLLLEREKLEVERTKARITGFALGIPLVAAALGLVLGIWNQNQQAKAQRAIQTSQELANFELKVAEIALNASGPISARNRAKALARMFPGKLPSDFGDVFEFSGFDGPEIEFFEARKLFFEAATRNSADLSTIEALWKQLFPWDKWPEKLGTAP